MSMTNAEKVARMMAVFGQAVPVTPIKPSAEVLELRKRLLAEEFFETEAEYDAMDLSRLSKELCDLLFVTYGFLLAIGVNPDARFNDVYISNMSKVAPDGTVLKDEFGKVLKGPKYSPTKDGYMWCLRNV